MDDGRGERVGRRLRQRLHRGLRRRRHAGGCLLRPALQAADGFLLLRHGVFGMGGRCRRGVAPVCIRARANDCASGHAKKRPQAALPFLPCARGRGWSGEYGGSPAEVGRHSGRAFLEEVERIGTQCVRDVTRMSQMCLGRRPQREARRHWACSRFAGDCSRTWRLRFMRIARAGREMGLHFFPQRTPGDAGAQGATKPSRSGRLRAVAARTAVLFADLGLSPPHVGRAPPVVNPARRFQQVLRRFQKFSDLVNFYYLLQRSRVHQRSKHMKRIGASRFRGAGSGAGCCA